MMTMMMAKGQFQQVAQAVSERLAELTGGPVAVADSWGQVIAANDPALVGRPAGSAALGTLPLEVPLQLNGENGRVLIAGPGDGEVLSPRVAATIVELLISQVVAIAALPDQHDLKNKFIYDLLHGPEADEADMRREGQILGMDFSRPRAVILIDAADYILDAGGADGATDIEDEATQVANRAQTIIRTVVNFFHLPNDMICAYIGAGEVAVLKSSAAQDLDGWSDPQSEGRGAAPSWSDLGALKRACGALLQQLRAETSAMISIGIGRYHPGIQGLARSYEDARTALLIGHRFNGPNQVHCLDGLGVAAFVGIADEQTKLDLARQLLSPLDAEPDLLRTLNRFFANNCSPSATAKQLSIHRNTLTLRLNKIRSLTGLDPRIFDEAVQMRQALLLRSPANICP